jgi:hypothetical protein
MELIISVYRSSIVVMDVMWAWRLGIPQMLWYRFKNRNNPQPNFEDKESV